MCVCSFFFSGLRAWSQLRRTIIERLVAIAKTRRGQSDDTKVTKYALRKSTRVISNIVYCQVRSEESEKRTKIRMPIQKYSSQCQKQPVFILHTHKQTCRSLLGESETLEMNPWAVAGLVVAFLGPLAIDLIKAINHRNWTRRYNMDYLDMDTSQGCHLRNTCTYHPTTQVKC